jgi:hypothetical protein
VINAWIPQRKIDHQNLNIDSMNGGYKFFLQILKTLYFKPFLEVNYRCGFGTTVPARKFIFVNKDDDNIVLLECINNYQFKANINDEQYVSDLHCSPYYFMRKNFTEFVAEEFGRYFDRNGMEVSAPKTRNEILVEKIKKSILKIGRRIK